jgi:hypothetical protein
MSTTISLRLIVRLDHRETFIRLYVPESHTIGELILYLNDRLRNENLEGNIYYMFNEFQLEIPDESLLGGPLFPEEIMLISSMIENNSLLFSVVNLVEGTEVSPLFPVEAQVPVPMPVPAPLNIQNLFGNINLLNIDQHAEIMDINSLVDMINVLGGQLVQPIAIPPPLAVEPLPQLNGFNALLALLQLPVAQQRLEDVIVGLDKNDLDKLRVDTFSNFADTGSNQRDTCSVCLEKLVETDICRELRCNHLFHKDCIDHWLDEHISCPVCREECGKGIPRL